jgi:hypothetical protein
MAILHAIRRALDATVRLSFLLTEHHGLPARTYQVNGRWRVTWRHVYAHRTQPLGASARSREITVLLPEYVRAIEHPSASERERVADRMESVIPGYRRARAASAHPDLIDSPVSGVDANRRAFLSASSINLASL